MIAAGRIFFAFVLAVAGAASAAPPALSPQVFATGLAAPVEIAHANDGTGRLFVLEQAGRIRVIRNAQVLATPFLDLRPAAGGPVLSGGEQGLLGLAFHPGYASNGRFYVYYTRARPGDPNGNDIVIARYNRSAGNPDVADPGSASIVLTIGHPQHANHNGGKLAFGPDGYLHAGVGDGGGAGDPFGAAQSLADLRGKILRIDVDGGAPYAIPPTNPFSNSSPPIRREIWDYGLRNPWRFSFDRATGDLFIGDVGQNQWEEIDFAPAGSGGRNYGWSVLEGTHCFNPPTGCSLANDTLPIIEYPHGGTGGDSVTGGYRYRGGALPALQGYYVYGDFVSGRIWAASPDGGGTWTTTQVATVANPSSFGEDENGELYVASFGGTIYRLTPAAATIPRLANISTRAPVFQNDNVMIAGFVIEGTKTVVVTGKGPSLAQQGVSGVLANPTLTLVRMSDHTVVASNDDWASAANASEVQASGFAPADSLESAILVTLPPGAYTAVLSGAGGTTGVGLAEAYEVNHPENAFVNISTRARVESGTGVMIGGFVIQGNASQEVVILGKGPSLTLFGVDSPLPNPTLTLVRMSDGAVIAANDDWGSAPNAAAIQASGFAPSHSLESAILLSLPPGAYTAILEGGGTGVGLVEVYRTAP